MNKKNIVIIGLGGVGGYFGFKINQKNDTQHHITCIVRGETYDVVNKDGLTLLSSEHPKSTTKPDALLKSIEDIQHPDLVLISVKEFDLENVSAQLKEVIKTDTIILPLMNGANIYDRIRKIIPNNTILPSCVYVASHIKSKGVVEHKGNPGKIIFGNEPLKPNDEIQWIDELFDKSKINYLHKDNVDADIWTKFIFIASIGLVSAKHNSSIGAVCTDEAQKEEATAIMQEVKLIADKKDIALPEGIISDTFEKAATFPPETPTSLQLDVNSGKNNNELELFAGAILNYGAVHDIPTPRTKSIYNEIINKINPVYSD